MNKFETAREILDCIHIPSLIQAIRDITPPPLESCGGVIVFAIIKSTEPIEFSMASMSVGEPQNNINTQLSTAISNYIALNERRLDGRLKEIASSTRIQPSGSEHVNPFRAGCIVGFNGPDRQIYVSFAGTGSGLIDEALSYVIARRLGFQMPPYENSHMHKVNNLTQNVVTL